METAAKMINANRNSAKRNNVSIPQANGNKPATDGHIYTHRNDGS